MSILEQHEAAVGALLEERRRKEEERARHEDSDYESDSERPESGQTMRKRFRQIKAMSSLLS